jgi:hypothetical protein
VSERVDQTTSSSKPTNPGAWTHGGRGIAEQSRGEERRTHARARHVRFVPPFSTSMAASIQSNPRSPQFARPVPRRGRSIRRGMVPLPRAPERIVPPRVRPDSGPDLFVAHRSSAGRRGTLAGVSFACPPPSMSSFPRGGGRRRRDFWGRPWVSIGRLGWDAAGLVPSKHLRDGAVPG